MAIDDEDCDSKLPQDINNSDLEAYSKMTSKLRVIILSLKTSRLTGFIAFSQLC